MKKAVTFFTTIIFSQLLFAQVQKISPEAEIEAKQQIEKTRQAILKCKGLSKDSIERLVLRCAKELKKDPESKSVSLQDFMVSLNYYGNSTEYIGDLETLIAQLNSLENTLSAKAEMEAAAISYNMADSFYFRFNKSVELIAKVLTSNDPIGGYYYNKSLFDYARCSFKQKHYRTAWVYYKAAAEYYLPDSSYYLSAKAMAKDNEKVESWAKPTLDKRVIEQFNKAIELNPSNKLYIGDRGKFYLLNLKDTANALADFATAVQLHTTDDELYYRLALLNYFKQKNPQEAIKNLSSCINLKPENADYYYIRAALNKDLKNYAAALPDFKNAIIYGKANPDYYNGSAFCNAQLDNYIAAYDDYSVALLLNPKDDYARSSLKTLDPVLQSEYTKMGFTPQNAFQFFMKIGDDYVKNNDKLHAALNFIKCTQVDPKNPQPYNKAGKIFSNYKMNTYAEQFLRYAAYGDGKNPEYFFDLGNFYLSNLEDYKKASGILDTAALLGSKNPEAYFLNGLCKQYELHNIAAALKDYSAAIAINPTFIDALKARGNLFFEEQKNYKAALADYQALQKLDPPNDLYKEFVKKANEKLKE